MKIGIYTLASQRDQKIDQMLAAELRKQDYEVFVRCYIGAARESVYYEKPDVTVLPMVGSQYKYDMVKQIKEWGVTTVVRRGEAGVGNKEWDRLGTIEHGEDRQNLHLGNWDYSPYVDLELVWGSQFGNIIADLGWMPEEKIRVCGAFAFDPCFEAMELPPLPAREKKKVLFATGFSTADCNPDYCETGIKNKDNTGYHRYLYDLHHNAREVWIDVINEFVRNFSDLWDIEVKARPGEQVRTYSKRLDPRVKVWPMATSSVDVMRSCDVVVHSGSTLAVEAYYMGIPSFNLCNVQPDINLAALVPEINSYRELEFHLEKVRKTGMRNNAREDVLHQLCTSIYGKINGKACHRAAGHIQHYLDRHGVSKPQIPDSWPKIPRYHIDKEAVKLEKTEGYTRWSCPGCREAFWSTYSHGTQRTCPYCGSVIRIEQTDLGMKPEAVLK